MYLLLNHCHYLEQGWAARFHEGYNPDLGFSTYQVDSHSHLGREGGRLPGRKENPAGPLT